MGAAIPVKIKRKIIQADAVNSLGDGICGIVNFIVIDFGHAAETEQEQHFRTDAGRKRYNDFFLELALNSFLFDFSGNESVEAPVDKAANSTGRPFVGKNAEREAFMSWEIGVFRRDVELHDPCSV